MLDLLSNQDFWSLVLGSLTALFLGGPRGFKLAKNFFTSKPEISQPSLEEENRHLKIENVELRKENKLKDQELVRTNKNYSRLEKLYDNKLDQINATRLDTLEDELAVLKEKNKING